MKVLIAGGAGYIGSTIASACSDAGISPVILDSLVTGRPSSPRAMRSTRATSPMGGWSTASSPSTPISAR